MNVNSISFFTSFRQELQFIIYQSTYSNQFLIRAKHFFKLDKKINKKLKKKTIAYKQHFVSKEKISLHTKPRRPYMYIRYIYFRLDHI